MIRIILKEFAPTVKTERWPNGVDTMYKLHLQCPMPDGQPMSRSVINQVWNGEMKKIGLGTMEAICLGLNCKISDWIIVEPDKPAPVKPTLVAAKPRPRKASNAKAKKVSKKASR